MRVWLVFLFGLFVPLLAQSQAPESVAAGALLAYEEGRFSEAAELAENSNSADAYGFAARALLAGIIVENSEIPDPAILDRAEAFAQKALDLVPDHQEARLQMAISRSMRTRSMSKIQAWKSGHGQAARKLAEGVIRDAPENPYADGFLSVWHIEAVRIGGRFGASFVGANIKSGRAHYERANQLNPDDAGLHWQYARSLTLLNAKKYRAEIDLALSRAIAAKQDNEVEKVFHKRALELKSALTAGQLEAALALAASLL